MDYSIIIPHHNSAHLLKRLLESIPQNGSFQIIVVDDNSQERELQIVKDLQSSFLFELYYNEGKTAGGARNTGLKHAKAPWILFADADDYYEPEMGALIERYKTSDYDIVFFNVTSRYTDTGEIAYRDEHIHTIAAKAKGNNDMNYLRCCYTAPWGKLIRRSVITENNIHFDEVIAANDMWFSVTSGLAADKVAYEETPLYCITVTGNSITTTLTKDRFESRFQVTLRVNELLRKNGLDKYQVSVLYFLGKAYQFGWNYQIHVIIECFKHHSNPFIGLNKILRIRSVMKDRQNTSVSR